MPRLEYNYEAVSKWSVCVCVCVQCMY